MPSDSKPTASPRSVFEEATHIATQFEYPTGELIRGVARYRQQMEEGLAADGATLSQIPSYITAVPNGTEKGLYLAVDLGGTNFRVCSVQLHGNSTFSITQNKVAMPRELMVTKSAKELFAFLAKQIEQFLKEHHSEHFTTHVADRKSGQIKEPYAEEHILDLGFTFSFPVIQHGINKGTLLRWTKGFDIQEAVGQDICELLQNALDDLHLPVRVAALINDTVGTLMARSYCAPGSTKALIGAIFGTGTNGAYVEKLAKVTKLGKDMTEFDGSTGEMVINAEWGSFDNELAVLPNTQFDKELDLESNNPGIQMFEKRVSGMFLGEVLRRALLSMVKDTAVDLFAAPANVPADSRIYSIWGIDTSFLSTVKDDKTDDLTPTKEIIERELGIENASTEDCRAVKVLVNAIGKRAARLSAVALAAVVISSGKLESSADEIIDIGVDGSLVEFYPGFEDLMREAFREIPEVGVEGDRRIRIGIAKDGSGVGAALGALVARKTAHR